MKRRRLGSSGLEVSPLVFGGNVFGWTVDEPTAFKLLDAFVGSGFNFIDTADVYPRWVPGNQGGESGIECSAGFQAGTLKKIRAARVSKRTLPDGNLDLPWIYLIVGPLPDGRGSDLGNTPSRSRLGLLTRMKTRIRRSYL